MNCQVITDARIAWLNWKIDVNETCNKKCDNPMSINVDKENVPNNQDWTKINIIQNIHSKECKGEAKSELENEKSKGRGRTFQDKNWNEFRRIMK